MYSYKVLNGWFCADVDLDFKTLLGLLIIVSEDIYMYKGKFCKRYAPLPKILV